MVDKLNITIQDKLTKKIKYILNLDGGWWYKEEFDTRGNIIYHEDSSGYCVKQEYDNRGNEIYYETSRCGILKDDR